MTPSDIHQLVESLCCGDESAFHTLIEGDKDLIPLLIQQFPRRTQGVDRARIIEVIWQFRDEATIPFSRQLSAIRAPTCGRMHSMDLWPLGESNRKMC